MKDKAVDLLAEYAALNHQEHAIKYLLENKKISDEDYETANAYIQKKKTEVNAQSDKLMEDRDTYYAIIKDPKFKERVKGAYAKSWLEFGKIASKFDTETLELLIKERDKGVWKAIELFRQESNLIETTGMLAKEINILRSEVKYLERLKETLHALNEMEESDETEDALDAVDDAIEELNELLKSYQEALDNSIKLYVHHDSAEDYKKQLTQYARYVKKVYETIKPEEFKKQKPRRIESDLW